MKLKLYNRNINLNHIENNKEDINYILMIMFDAEHLKVSYYDRDELNAYNLYQLNINDLIAFNSTHGNDDLIHSTVLIDKFNNSIGLAVDPIKNKIAFTIGNKTYDYNISEYIVFYNDEHVSNRNLVYKNILKDINDSLLN